MSRISPSELTTSVGGTSTTGTIRARTIRVACQASNRCNSTKQAVSRTYGISRYASPVSLVSSWFILHAQTLIFITLLLAYNLYLPIATAAAVSAESAVDAASTSSTTSSSSSPPAHSPSSPPLFPPKPHVLFVSLPWRGHVFPLRNIGERLQQQGFHISFAASSEESRLWIEKGEFDIVTGGNFKACARVKRHSRKETQPSFQATAHIKQQVNATLIQALPGAQIVDFFSQPEFAWQATEQASNSSAFSASSSPNGLNLLMRTFADFQSCMLRSLQTSVSDMLRPSHYLDRYERDVKQREALVRLFREEHNMEEAGMKEKELQLFPLPRMIAPPQLIVVDRFTFAGIDVAKQFDIPYVINNPYLLLDLDSPSWALPSPLSYLPATPPLSISARIANFFHRMNYRASMYRSLSLINQNRIKVGLHEMSSWSDYYASPPILTNSVWGIELHRSSDSQGLHSHRNVNVQANGYTPRFRMTGPLLPLTPIIKLKPPFSLHTTSNRVITNSTTGVSSAGSIDLEPISSNSFQHSIPGYGTSGLEAKLQKFIAEAPRGNAATRWVYINLGDGDDLTKSDVTVVLQTLKAYAKEGSPNSLYFIWSLPKRNWKALLPAEILDTIGVVGSQGMIVPFVPQFPLLATYTGRIVFTMMHASLSNVQESFAAGLPVLLMPHPAVEQIEVTNHVVRTNAVLVLQRLLLTPSNLQACIDKLLTDSSYLDAARQLSPFFLPSSSVGTLDAAAFVEFIARSGWSHLVPLTDNPDQPLPFYRDFLYSFPLDVYVIYILVISLVVLTLKQSWSVFMGIWNGGEKKF